MTDYLATIIRAVRTIDPQAAGSCLLGLDLILFGILAMFWEEAGRSKLFPLRRKHARAKRES